MNDTLDITKLASPVLAAVEQASQRIMEIYRSNDFAVQLKSDQSPVTAADLAANEIIVATLRKLTPGVAIVSEELPIPAGAAFTTEPYWLIDPVDGTRQFIERRDEFTVNVALIVDRKPVLGVVAAPALELTYYGGLGLRATKLYRQQQSTLHVQPSRENPVAAVSRSHPSDATHQWLAEHQISDTLAAGSSLKICYVADHTVDVYPHLGPQHEWDIAAADAVLRAAGGCIIDHTTGQALVYGKPADLTPFYIAGTNLPDQRDYRQPAA